MGLSWMVMHCYIIRSWLTRRKCKPFYLFIFFVFAAQINFIDNTNKKKETRWWCCGMCTQHIESAKLGIFWEIPCCIIAQCLLGFLSCEQTSTTELFCLNISLVVFHLPLLCVCVSFHLPLLCVCVFVCVWVLLHKLSNSQYHNPKCLSTFRTFQYNVGKW